jgi:hypothetical protein
LGATNSTVEADLKLENSSKSTGKIIVRAEIIKQSNYMLNF